MARKLTDEERNTVEALNAVLVEALAPEERSNAAGIASSLVRFKEDRITEEELAELLAKYEEGEGGLVEAVKAAVLSPAEDDPGAYTLRPSILEEAGKGASADEPAKEPTAMAKQPPAAREKKLAKRPKARTAAGKEERLQDAGQAREDAAPAEPGEEAPKAGREASTAGDDTSEGPASADEAPKPKRRRRSRRKTASDAEAKEEPEGDSEKGQGAESASSEKAGQPEDESAKKDLKPGRASRARKRAEHEEALAAEEGQAVESAREEGAAPAEDEHVDEKGQGATDTDSTAGSSEEAPKPKRRPRRRTKVNASAAAEPAAEAPGDDQAQSASEEKAGGDAGNAGEEDAPKKKPSRRRRKPAARSTAAAESEPSDDAAPGEAPEASGAASEGEAGTADAGQPEKPKPSRRRHRSRRSAKPAAEPEGDASQTEQGQAEDAADAPAPQQSAGAEAAAEAGEAPEDAGESPDQGAEAASSAEADAPAADEAGLKAAKEKKEQKRDPRRIPYIRKGDEEDAELRRKIVQLDPRFWMNGWLLSHPSAYSLYEHEIATMNDVLENGTVVGDITRRQLAYQMGGDEKFFEYGNDGFRLLRALGMEDIVRRRPMPKVDLIYHAPRRRKHMRVLVTENLDPYLDVHDIMYEEGRSQILGERIHAVVLGAGSPVLEHNRMSLLLDNLGAETIEVLYWGDIDRAGLQILVRLNDILKDKYRFRTFAPAYRLMIQKAMERFPDPADNEPTGQVNIEMEDTSLLCDGLTDEEAAYACEVIKECRLIPQEILTRRDL